MRNPPGEHAQALQPLRLPRLFFCLLPLGDIGRNLQVSDRPVFQIPPHSPAAGNHNSGSVALGMTQFSLPVLGLIQLSFDLRQGLREFRLEEIMRHLTDRLLTRPAVALFSSTIPELDYAIPAQRKDRILGQVEQLSLLSKCLDEAPFLSNVRDHSDPTVDHALFGVRGDVNTMDPAATWAEKTHARGEFHSFALQHPFHIGANVLETGIADNLPDLPAGNLFARLTNPCGVSRAHPKVPEIKATTGHRRRHVLGNGYKLALFFLQALLHPVGIFEKAEGRLPLVENAKCLDRLIRRGSEFPQVLQKPQVFGVELAGRIVSDGP